MVQTSTVPFLCNACFYHQRDNVSQIKVLSSICYMYITNSLSPTDALLAPQSSLIQFKLANAPVIRYSILLTDFLELKQTKENLQLFCSAKFLMAYVRKNVELHSDTGVTNGAYSSPCDSIFVCYPINHS